MSDNEIEKTHILRLIADLNIALAVCPPYEKAGWKQEIDEARSYLAELESYDAEDADTEDDDVDVPYVVNSPSHRLS